jgi:hypothetical protein
LRSCRTSFSWQYILRYAIPPIASIVRLNRNIQNIAQWKSTDKRKLKMDADSRAEWPEIGFRIDHMKVQIRA